MSVIHARIDKIGRAKTHFKVGDVLFRMTPGAMNPVTRYFVQSVLSQDTYRVQLFDSEGELMTKSLVVTPDRASQYHPDPVATKLMAKLRRYSGSDESIF